VLDSPISAELHRAPTADRVRNRDRASVIGTRPCDRPSVVEVGRQTVGVIPSSVAPVVRTRDWQDGCRRRGALRFTTPIQSTPTMCGDARPSTGRSWNRSGT
jgi:hypothetical protein